MRRPYYRFFGSPDPEFTLLTPFRDALARIVSFNNREEKRGTGPDRRMVKSMVQLTKDRTLFGQILPDALAPGAITECADFRITLQLSGLSAGQKVPLSGNTFLIRITDRGSTTRCELVAEGRHPGMTVQDLKAILEGA
jgi:hypothetical protein